jgi:hypothetical protein
MADIVVGQFNWERMAHAVEKVRERLLRATAALEKAGIPYAVAGGNAVAAWVATVDESAVRNTPDVDILLRRIDLDLAKTALTAAGFVYRRAQHLDLFLENQTGKERDAVRIVYSGEKARPEHFEPAPDVAASEQLANFRTLSLAALIRMNLVQFRTIDRVRLRDMIDVGLLDASWLYRLPPYLVARLQELLDNPEG